MTKRKRLMGLGCFALALSVAAVLLLPHYRWGLVGLLHNERFYHGLPTSYWRAQVKAFQARGRTVGVGSPPREPGIWTKVKRFFGPQRQPAYGALVLADCECLPLLDQEAQPVLAEMLDDEDDTVREFAEMAIRGLERLAAWEAEDRKAVSTSR